LAAREGVLLCPKPEILDDPVAESPKDGPPDVVAHFTAVEFAQWNAPFLTILTLPMMKEGRRLQAIEVMAQSIAFDGASVEAAGIGAVLSRVGSAVLTGAWREV
jgi:hypothetical protein